VGDWQYSAPTHCENAANAHAETDLSSLQEALKKWRLNLGRQDEISSGRAAGACSLPSRIRLPATRGMATKIKTMSLPLSSATVSFLQVALLSFSANIP
jgi:hypothetical protein